jgi:hypothetical protein
LARLAQTSVRFRSLEVDEEELFLLGTQIDRVAAGIAREIYGEGVEVDVVLEAGSLLIRITVLGAFLLGTYDAVSKYPDFKLGVEKLVEDANHYGSAVYKQILKLTGEKEADSVVKRDMTPGTISRLIDRLENLQELQKHAPAQISQHQLRQIIRELEAIERDLQPQERQIIDRALEQRGLPPLRELPERIPGVEGARMAILREREERVGRAPTSGDGARKRKLRYHNRTVV